MRSRQELLEASGYGDRPKDFDDLIRILDSEVRLITPTDPEGIDSDSPSTSVKTGQKFYQLTHDYLVPSLRDWLTRKQKETRRGRAELRLADRAAAVEGEAGEPTSAIAMGVSQHPAADRQEEMDRAAAEDDETRPGGFMAFARGSCCRAHGFDAVRRGRYPARSKRNVRPITPPPS